jgi:O-antigen ligase/tetratricopeptide (TPR) repeat protein
MPQGDSNRTPATHSTRRRAVRSWTADDWRGQLQARLLNVVDGGLAGVIFIVPLLMGGRQALGQLVLISLALVIAAAWALRQGLSAQPAWRRTPAIGLLWAGLALLFLQLLPLPEAVLGWLSPAVAESLPLWSSQAPDSVRLGPWTQVSLTPQLTFGGLLLFGAYSLVFCVTVQRIEGLADVERLLRWMAWSAAAMAIFGIVQYLASNGKFFWFYQHPYSNTFERATGAFSNRNHFAHFLALGTGPLLWWLQQLWHAHQTSRRTVMGPAYGDSNREQVQLIGGAMLAGVVMFAGLMSLSRGGALAMFLAAALCMGIYYWARLLSKKSLLVGLAVSSLVAAALAIHGYRRVATRLDHLSLNVERLDEQGVRRRIWTTVCRAIPDYWRLGSGVGSHREVYPIYLQQPADTDYTHAENGYLQVTLEAGLPGLGLMLSGIGILAWWCVGILRAASQEPRPTASAPAPSSRTTPRGVRSLQENSAPRAAGGRHLPAATDSLRRVACCGAVAGSLAANVAHSVGDFVWYVPACMAIVAILAGCAARLWQISQSRSGIRENSAGPATATDDNAAPALRGVNSAEFSRIPLRGAWIAATGCLVLLAAWILPGRASKVLAEPHWQRYLIQARANLDPVTGLESLSRELETALRIDPDQSRAHLRLAAVCLSRFNALQLKTENPMTLEAIRDAAVTSRFASRGDLDAWLARAVGPHRVLLDQALWHTRQGLARCPLHGEGYLYLADLGFLESPEASRSASYVEQALRVRPLDGDVLVKAGEEASLAGDPERALEWWRKCFHSGLYHRSRLVDLLAPRVPAAFFLEYFEPDLEGLRLLYDRYRGLGRTDQSLQLAPPLARAAEAVAARRGPDAARHWFEAHGLYALVQDHASALRCGREALDAGPGDYRIRYEVGRYLYQQQRYSEAEPHLVWCSRRKTPDPVLTEMLQQVVKQRIDRQTQSRSARTAKPSDQR